MSIATSRQGSGNELTGFIDFLGGRGAPRFEEQGQQDAAEAFLAVLDRLPSLADRFRFGRTDCLRCVRCGWLLQRLRQPTNYKL